MAGIEKAIGRFLQNRQLMMKEGQPVLMIRNPNGTYTWLEYHLIDTLNNSELQLITSHYDLADDAGAGLEHIHSRNRSHELIGSLGRHLTRISNGCCKLMLVCRYQVKDP